jgi:hypothetical protein
MFLIVLGEFSTTSRDQKKKLSATHTKEFCEHNKKCTKVVTGIVFFFLSKIAVFR